MQFDRYKVGQKHLSTRNENAKTEALEGLLTITGADAFIGPTGVHFRRQLTTLAVFWVRVQANETANGVYNGNLVDHTAAIDPATTNIYLWGTAVGEEIVIVNKLEPSWGTGHALTDDPAHTDFPATWGGMTSETPPRRVAIIAGINLYECGT